MIVSLKEVKNYLRIDFDDDDKLIYQLGGSITVELTANKMKDGTYKDQVTGNSFTVSGGKIRGTVGSTGIAVVYNAESLNEPKVSASPANNSSFRTDTLAVTLNCKNVASATYTTSEPRPSAYP